MTDNNETIWILEDDEDCQVVYVHTLGKSFDLIFFASLNDFYDHLSMPLKKAPVLLLADLGLDDGNFVDFLKSSKRSEISIDLPITIVSADDDVDTLRECFKLGVEDYLTKPFKKNELLVKVEALLRKNHSFIGKIKTTLEIDGKKIEGLTGKERKLFQLFLENESREVQRERILTEVWGGRHVHPKSVDVHIYNLRRKLQDQGYLIKSLGSGRWGLLSSLL